MSERFYTSPELSKELAGAGCSQGDDACCLGYDDESIEEEQGLVEQSCADATFVRAFRLDEVLEELMRLKVECEMSSGVTGTTFHIEHGEEDSFCQHEDTDAVAVVAAGNVLLALLRERQKK